MFCYVDLLHLPLSLFSCLFLCLHAYESRVGFCSLNTCRAAIFPLAVTTVYNIITTVLEVLPRLLATTSTS